MLQQPLQLQLSGGTVITIPQSAQVTENKKLNNF